MSKPTIFVCITAYHPFIGGAEISIQEITKRLSSQFDFVICTSRFRRDLPRKEQRPEGVVMRFGIGMRFDKWLLPFLIPIYFMRSSLIKSKNNVVVLGVDISHGSLAAALIKLFFPSISFIFNIQYGDGEERLAKGRIGFIGYAFRFLLKRADYVTAISTYLFEQARTYGFNGSAAVVHNGVDLEKFKIQNSKFKNINKKLKVIITVSRLVLKNGIDVLIHAFAEVKKQIPDAVLHIIGDGPESTNLKSYVKSFKLENMVIFFGSVPYEKIPEYLGGADIFVRPSRSEGMGNAFVEALAAGIPIIGTPIGGIADIIKDGETGLFARVDDSHDCAEKIIRLLHDDSLRTKIIQNGKHLIEEKFSWDSIARQYATIFLYRTKFGTNSQRIVVATPLFPPDIGGPATYSKTLLEELPLRGIIPKIVSFSSVRHLPKGVRHLVYFFKILIHARSADIIFAQDPVSVGMPAWCAAIVLGKKFMVKIVGDYAWEQGVGRFGVTDMLDEFLKKKYGWKISFLRFIESFVARRADRIIVPSEYLKQAVQKWGVPIAKIHVIYNSFDPPALKFSKPEIREKLHLGGMVLVSAGRLVLWKGFAALVDLMPTVLKRIPDAKLFIIGDGPEKKHLMHMVKGYGLEARIKFLGSISHGELMDYFAAGDMFILNTGYEGFSHTLLEAMASGLPIITTPVGGNKEMVKHGENGLLVRYNNKEEIMNTILTLWSNVDLREVIGKKAEMTSRQFTKERMIEETAALIKKI